MRLILDGDVLEVSDRVESRVTIQSAVAHVVALDVETAEEFADETSCVVVADSVFLGCAVGKTAETCAVFDADTCDGVERDKGLRVLSAVIVRALHECALRISVSNFQISTYGRDKVAQNLLACSVEMELICAHNQFRLYG